MARPARVEQVTPEQPRTESDRPETSFEDLLGGRILAWLGGLAIVVGVVLFLVIAVDRGWIGVEARVALAFAGSTVLLAVGLFLYERRGQTDAAVAAVAGALAALYASLTYATAVQDVIAEEAGLLVAATRGCGRSDDRGPLASQFVAALALLGALAAPVLVGGETSGLALAFMVVALVATVGVLLWQRWGWLALGAFLVSAPQLAFWAWDRDDLVLPLASSRCTGASSSSRRSATSYAFRLGPARVLGVGAAAERGLRRRSAGRSSTTGIVQERRRGCSASRSPTSSSAASASASG